MRVLFATTAGAGHFGPLVPFAHATREADHRVLVAAPRTFESAVRGAGFDFAPLGERSEEDAGALFARVASASFEEGNRLVVGEGFGSLYPRAALPAMLDLVERWRPDIIVRETVEYASLVAARRYGVPHAHVPIGLLAGADELVRLVIEPLRRLAADNGLADLDVRRVLDDETLLTITPPALERPADRGRATAYRVPGSQGAGRRPADTPLVYVTFGSEAANFGYFPGLYRSVIDALASDSMELLVSVGRNADPAALGALPPGVRVERWVDQDDVFRQAAAAVTHGGYGSTLGALLAGVPLAVMPLFASDQALNAQRVTEVGAGLRVEPGAGPAATVPDDDAPKRLREAVRRILDEPGFREASVRIAAEAAALPPIGDAVRLLEAVADASGDPARPS